MTLANSSYGNLLLVLGISEHLLSHNVKRGRMESDHANEKIKLKKMKPNILGFLMKLASDSNAFIFESVSVTVQGTVRRSFLSSKRS